MSSRPVTVRKYSGRSVIHEARRPVSPRRCRRTSGTAAARDGRPPRSRSRCSGTRRRRPFPPPRSRRSPSRRAAAARQARRLREPVDLNLYVLHRLLRPRRRRDPARAGAILCPYCACANAGASPRRPGAARAQAASRAGDAGRRKLGRAACVGLRARPHDLGVHRLVRGDAAERIDVLGHRLAHRDPRQARLLRRARHADPRGRCGRPGSCSRRPCRTGCS